MQKSINDYPRNFDPAMVGNALKGLSELIEYFVCEGPATNLAMSPGALASLQGLSYVQRRLANELYDYLCTLSEAGIDLPVPPEEIRERRGLYRVK
ncbi:MAG: hypothetical protein R3270_06525 [Gammaproteobacteria bacterium]|nr:hypothetical protein [Gammaproteobacteria bacterium]